MIEEQRGRERVYGAEKKERERKRARERARASLGGRRRSKQRQFLDLNIANPLRKLSDNRLNPYFFISFKEKVEY